MLSGYLEDVSSIYSADTERSISRESYFFEDGPGKKAFKFVAGDGYQPPYEFFILKNEGRVRDFGEKTVFDENDEIALS